ncbi:extracellular solute-binding protein [Oceanobacillus timonensis]|uniref:extracellular solute-binding protein n=1 Tax=Oceanobacillus timonensis TaxID=1926285 RepID=UPI0009B9FD20|nr:extracellular solute-binding protein [Oceanobacillus timonensis]
MKNRLVLLIGIILTAITLVACSGGSDDADADQDVEVPEGATEVVMWNLFGGGDADFMQEIVDEYNESQDEIFINNVQQEFEEYYTKLITSVSAGQGPDLAISHTNVLPELVSQGLIQELDTQGSEVGVNWDEFNQNILESTVFDEQHYAVPIDTHPHIFFVNNELVGDAGLMNEDGSVKMEQTPEGFVEFLTTLKQELPEDKFPMAFSTAGVDSYRLWFSFYSQLGGENIVTDNLENPEYVLDVDKAIEAANYMHDLWHEHEVIPTNLAEFYADFQSGNAATISTGVWATGTWEATEDLEFTALPAPNIFGKDAAFGNSHTFVIPTSQDADPEVQKGAIEFMDYATDKGVVWAEAGHIPAKSTVVESKEYAELPYRSDYVEVADYVNFPDQTIHARGIQDIMVRNLDLIWTDEATPEEAFELIENEVKSLIGE